jgi:hypothetical protein
MKIYFCNVNSLCETVFALSDNIPTLYKLTEGVDSVVNMAETDES